VHRTQSAKTKKKKQKESRDLLFFLSVSSWIDVWIRTTTTEIPEQYH